MSDNFNGDFKDENEFPFINEDSLNKNYDNGYYNDNKNNKRKRKNSGSGGKIVALSLVFAIIGALIGGAVSAKLTADRFETQFSKLSENGANNNITITPDDNINTVSAVANANLDSVVGITTKTIVKDFFNRSYESEAMGSGFIVDEDGYIVTNDHVVASLYSQTGYSDNAGYADDITVILNDGTQLPAKVLFSESSLDIAILKVETDKKLPKVKLGNSGDLKIGEQVIAIGNPLALEFHGTVTSGVVSGLNRSLSTGDSNNPTMTNLIQTDASINSGNSGGPLFNSKGEVVGINTMKITTGEGMGFSISIDTIKPIIEQVIETGTFEKVSVGITGTDVEKYESILNVKLSVDKGVIVIEVLPGTSAAKAGLKTNDIITKIDGEELDSFEQLRKKLINYKFGDTAKFEIIRDGKTEEIDLTFEKTKTQKMKSLIN